MATAIIAPEEISAKIGSKENLYELLTVDRKLDNWNYFI